VHGRGPKGTVEKRVKKVPEREKKRHEPLKVLVKKRKKKGEKTRKYLCKRSKGVVSWDET